MFLPSEFYIVFSSNVSMGNMRKWSLKNLEEMQDSSHMTGKKKRKEWTGHVRMHRGEVESIVSTKKKGKRKGFRHTT